MENAKIIAELLGIEYPKFCHSPYTGIEILWNFNFEKQKYSVITVCHNFAYTKSIEGLPGNWILEGGDYFLYF